jgi:capsular polysaccharide biosynthesis protein
MFQDDQPIPLPLAARCERIASPALPVIAPAMAAGWGDTPGPVRARLEALWHRRVLPVRAIDVYRLRNVFVLGEGLVFDEAQRLYAPTVGAHTPQQVAAARQTLHGWAAQGGIPGHAGTSVLCKSAGTFATSHWLIALAPRAFLAAERLQLRQARYLIHALPDPQRDLVRDSLARFAIPPEAILETGPAPVFCEELILVEGLRGRDGTLSPLIGTAMARLAEGIAPGTAERILITARAPSGWRVDDEARLNELAAAAGYTLLDPSAMSLAGQIAAFSGAHRLAGLAGPGMAPLLFAPSGAHVRCLTAATASETDTWMLCQIRAQRYAELRCPEADTQASPFLPRVPRLATRPADLRALLAG